MLCSIGGIMGRKTYDAIIFDGKNTAHKAYHVNKYLSVNVDGEQVCTGMMYGFLGMMLNIYSQFANKDTRIFVAWDSKDSAESNRALCEGYKANRKPATKEELEDRIQFDSLMSDTMDFLATLNIMQFQKSKVEADDIAASLAHKLECMGKSVLIVTEDKDYRQLITDNIHLYGITQKLVWNIDVFQAKTGLSKPSHFIDYLAICGDSIDGFDGVSGFGHVKAIQLLTDENFVDLDSVSLHLLSNPDSLENLTSWTANTKAKFVDGLDELNRCYQLAKLDTDINSVELLNKECYQYLDGFFTFANKYKMKSFLGQQNLSYIKDIHKSTRCLGMVCKSAKAVV